MASLTSARLTRWEATTTVLPTKVVVTPQPIRLKSGSIVILPGVGSGVEIEFVDPTGSGEYRIARNPNEKDALLNVPGAGLTLSEQLGLSNKGRSNQRHGRCWE